VLEVSGQVCGEYENEKGCGCRYGTAGTGIGKRAGRCRDGGSENSWTALCGKVEGIRLCTRVRNWILDKYGCTEGLHLCLELLRPGTGGVRRGEVGLWEK